MSTTTITSREIRLASRPFGEPDEGTFDLVETQVPEPGPGQILVRNTWMSVDPYMRTRMNAGESYIPPFEVGAPLEGSAIGEVVASEADTIPVGAAVSHFAGWREYAVLDAAHVQVIDVENVRPQDYLGALGTTGLTAYLAVTEIAPVREGDVVFVSAAAGAVGSVAGQLARRFGAARVIGSAGGPEKSRKLTETFGFDAAIDYRAGSVAEQLAELAPEGIDVYIDNVGGDHLEAAIESLNDHGKVAMVGMISTYNATEPSPAPRNLPTAQTKRLTLRGLVVSDHFDRFPEYIETAAPLLADGSLVTEETIVDGLENAPSALLGLLRGANTGKMLIRLTA
ncbi:NADP-dependent oxidoreductase [Saccharomonospora xinjiangensis]|uniref:NADP-dependent oxidoreductase n=1 Tax=Saccharomonospora xinjiangensis TaxID=75294 RepID=UPI00107064D1|nr:NADP-dependent oxidoreductase [Saccharomonospora xinjiangensis]QBQ58414.1 NADPH-dependent curcumin reductase [Saccharomonospora xinjiangensis]